ncbi:MAG: ArsR/SmtB family transcription factor [Caldilineaceae bacterium]
MSQNKLQFESIVLTSAAPDSSMGCCALPPSLRLSNGEAELLAGLCKALSHPVRMQMVELLSRYGGQMCVCDIEGQFSLSQPTISHHLKLLREAGLVRAEQRGLWSYYTLRADRLAPLQGLLAQLRVPAEADAVAAA